MVFFDWDRYNLSQQALTTIQQAADSFKSTGSARITATGHTDRSGPDNYNMALSLRRANAVKDALVRDGVPAGADPWLLTEILREQWGFTGTVVSDYWAVPFLWAMHRVAEDATAAGAAALAAGIDVELPDTVGFGPGLVKEAESGRVSVDLVDRGPVGR